MRERERERERDRQTDRQTDRQKTYEVKFVVSNFSIYKSVSVQKNKILKVGS